MENDSRAVSNPYILQVTLPDNVPVTQAEDTILDVNVTHWGFYRALTYKEKMIADPIFRAEQHAGIQELSSRIDLARFELRPTTGSHSEDGTVDIQE